MSARSDHAPDDLEDLIATLKGAKKYRAIDVADATVRDILLTEFARQPNRKAALHAAKKKLHEVVALYLGDPDYARAMRDLAAAFDSGDPQRVRAVCRDLLRIHDSTAERLELRDTFYPRLWSVTGAPQTVLDLACGLNPLMFPWMHLPDGVTFYAYDIHTPRVALLNHYFTLQGMSGQAVVQDVLVDPPRESGNVALLLKELHRMEKRRKGIVLPLLDALDVTWIALSSPTRSRSGHGVIDAYRAQVHELLSDQPWTIADEIAFENELVYVIRKHGQP